MTGTPILNKQTLPQHLDTVADVLYRHDQKQLDLAMTVANPARRVQLSQGLVAPERTSVVDDKRPA